MKKSGKKKKTRSKMNWKAIGFYTLLAFVVAILVVGGAVGYKYVVTTPLLNIENVEITGNDHVPEQYIWASLDLRDKNNIFQVNLPNSSRNLEKIPWVKHANIRRRLPHTLLIEIREHVPIAIVAANDYFYLSRNGKLFKRVGPNDQFDFPIITGLDPVDLEKRVTFAKGVLDQAHQMLLWSENARWISSDSISEINIDSSEGFSIFMMQSSTKIILGKQNLIESLERLERVMDDYKDQILASKIIDLRFKERVVARSL